MGGQGSVKSGQRAVLGPLHRTTYAARCIATFEVGKARSRLFGTVVLVSSKVCAVVGWIDREDGRRSLVAVHIMPGRPLSEFIQ